MSEHYDLRKLQDLSIGNDDFVLKMVLLFLKQTPDLMDQMKSAFMANDINSIARIAHKMKSGIDTFCVSEITEDVRMLERATDQSWSETEIHNAVNRLLNVLTYVIAELQVQFKIG